MYVELLLLTVTNNSVVLLRSSVLFILRAIFLGLILRWYSTGICSKNIILFGPFK